jgi:hypothetical protein
MLREHLKGLRTYAQEYAYLDNREEKDPRRRIFERLRKWRRETEEILGAWLGGLGDDERYQLASEMGLDLCPGYASFEVHGLNFARKSSPDGRGIPQAIVSIVQARTEGRTADPARQRRTGSTASNGGTFAFRGGCTVVVDLRSGDIDYVIRKNIRSATRLKDERAFQLSSGMGLAGVYLGGVADHDTSRRLALLHGYDAESEGG